MNLRPFSCDLRSSPLGQSLNIVHAFVHGLADLSGKWKDLKIRERDGYGVLLTPKRVSKDLPFAPPNSDISCALTANPINHFGGRWQAGNIWQFAQFCDHGIESAEINAEGVPHARLERMSSLATTDEQRSRDSYRCARQSSGYSYPFRESSDHASIFAPCPDNPPDDSSA
jgi:hypothetical protein